MANVINQDQLKDLLNQKGTTIVSFTAVVDPKLKKTGNPFDPGQVMKRSVVNGMVGWNYQNSVNNQRVREGNEEEFVAHPRKWGERIQGTPFVEHNDKTYLELKVESTKDPVYLVDGKEATDAQLETIHRFLPTRSGSSRQGTEKMVIIRDYNLATIKSIKTKGQEYTVEEVVLPTPTRTKVQV
jgi:hypothetical protein